MANDNLIPQSKRTKDEQRKIARQGGIASGKARRKKKLLRECLEILLEKEITDKNGNKMTGAEALSAKLFNEAIKGNIRAFEVLRDTAGQKVPDKVIVAEVDPDVIAEVESIINDTVTKDCK